MNSTADQAMANAYVPGRAIVPRAEQVLIERRQDLLGPAYRLMYDSPLHFRRGSGVWLYDADGRAFLDAYNNVASLGHCHPAVVEAITSQVATLATNTRYIHETILDYAERLIGTFPQPLLNVMFTCSGSEANDLAYRIAKVFTGGIGIIITETAYHGITDAVAQFSPSLGEAVDLGSHVRTVAAPDTYRSNGAMAAAFSQSVENAIVDLRRHGIQPAMLIVDSMFTSDGIVAEPTSFLAPAVDAVRRAGGIFVADEVQPGFGRTGSHMWGFQRHGVVPDLVTLGKPMGNGHPVAAVVAKPDVIERFGKQARYFNTYGGNAVSCAAALAVLDTIQRDQLMENAAATGLYFQGTLSKLAKDNPQLGDVRGAGLMIGIEVVRNTAKQEADPTETARIVNGLRNHRVLISSCGPKHNVLKIRPPLIFTTENADAFMDAFHSVMEEH